MKQLMLVRHSKSDWADITLTDFDRPLNARGLSVAPQMALRLISKNIVPQAILSSPALRAKTTAQIFAETLNIAAPSYNSSIYNASYPTLLEVINTLPDEHNFIALFGHNPGISETVYNLSGHFYDMPTCAIAVIAFEIDEWAMVSGTTGTLTYYDFPKNN